MALVKQESSVWGRTRLQSSGARTCSSNSNTHPLLPMGTVPHTPMFARGLAAPTAYGLLESSRLRSTHSMCSVGLQQGYHWSCHVPRLKKWAEYIRVASLCSLLHPLPPNKDSVLNHKNKTLEREGLQKLDEAGWKTKWLTWQTKPSKHWKKDKRELSGSRGVLGKNTHGHSTGSLSHYFLCKINVFINAWIC